MNLLRNPCSGAENLSLRWKVNLKSALSIYSIGQVSFWQYKNCSKIQELANRGDLYTPALGPFNYRKRKCKYLYQFSINLTLSVSIRQILEVLKQRLNLNLLTLTININLGLCITWYVFQNSVYYHIFRHIHVLFRHIQPLLWHI